MVALTELLHLSPHDEEGFLEFERIARAEMEEEVARQGPAGNWTSARLEYMSAVQAAFEEFNIQGTDGLASAERTFDLDDFNWFNQAAKKVVTRLQVRALRRTSTDLIELEPNDKVTLIKEVGRLKNRVTNAADLTEDRKKLIIKRLDALLQEIEKPRFNIKEFAVAVAAVAGALGLLEGVAIQAPETIVRLLEVVDLAHGKQAERLAVIERYRKPPAIEHKPARETFDLEDEIPF